jgi:dihydroneopterin triphosphate diphosphatase
LSTILSQIVEVCIIRLNEGKSQYLLLQRADDEELYPGLWQIVTGSMKKNETSVQSVLRELKEETGLNIKKIWTVPMIDSYLDFKADIIQMVPVFAVEVDSNSEVRLSHEHQSFQWLSYSEAKQRVVWPGQRNVIDVVHEFISGGKEAARLLDITSFLSERKLL